MLEKKHSLFFHFAVILPMIVSRLPRHTTYNLQTSHTKESAAKTQVSQTLKQGRTPFNNPLLTQEEQEAFHSPVVRQDLFMGSLWRPSWELLTEPCDAE